MAYISDSVQNIISVYEKKDKHITGNIKVLNIAEDYRLYLYSYRTVGVFCSYNANFQFVQVTEL